VAEHVLRPHTDFVRQCRDLPPRIYPHACITIGTIAYLACPIVAGGKVGQKLKPWVWRQAYSLHFNLSREHRIKKRIAPCIITLLELTRILPTTIGNGFFLKYKGDLLCLAVRVPAI